jgi:hypothetical protein
MAGLEERLSKLEKILHRLFCCDTNEFTGPQGPQGPQGETGEPGPPGADGAIIFQNLNWMGAWTPCVIYNQFDAVSYNGSSYFMNCESSATYECEYPPENPTCWILLANAGATGPQGPTGLIGNDGSNSGRWKFLTTSDIVGAPGSTYFVTDTLNLNTLTRIIVNFDDINSTDYEAWWTALYDFGVDYPGSLFFIQITEVGSNNIIGIYQVEYKAPSFDMALLPNRISIGLAPMYVSNSVFTPNKNYTISWSIHGGVNGGNAPKTKGEVSAQAFPGPYPTLQYDFNEALSSIPWDIPTLSRSYVALPTPTVRGQQLYLTTRGNNDFAIISHNGSFILNVYGIGGVAGGLVEEFLTVPGDMFKFTWDGDYWIVENIEGQANFFNGKRTQEDKFQFQETYYDNITLTFPTQTWLNTSFPVGSYGRGSKIFFAAIPGGPRCFVRMDATNWQSFPTNTVI